MNSLKKSVDQQTSAPLWPVGGGGGLCKCTRGTPGAPASNLNIRVFFFFFFLSFNTLLQTLPSITKQNIE